ncbi:hypothetical protein M798_11700 [Brucella melitensis ADMAS-G1]|nr:hypothetical protein M798_11700 [Brucella melitensis ADMAS-G1]
MAVRFSLSNNSPCLIGIAFQVEKFPPPHEARLTG